MSNRNPDYVSLAASPPEDSNALSAHKSAPIHTAHNGTIILQGDGHGYTYSYGPAGLNGLLDNKYALACAVFVSIGGLLFGYDQGVIANVLVMPDFIARWPVGPWEKGLMTAALELGAVIGVIAAGVLADRHSRLYSISLACVIFCFGSSLQFNAQTLSVLTWGRAIGGIGVGALSMLSPLYMTEISPPELRGSLVALEQFSIVLGVVLGFWIGFFTRNIAGSWSWRIPLALQVLPGILLCIGSAFLPASPRLLVSHGQYEDAVVSLAKLRRRSPEEAQTDPLIQIELLEMRVEIKLTQQGLTEDRKYTWKSEARAWARLFDKKYLRRTLIGISMMFFQQWSGINALLYYGPTLVKSIGMRGDTVTLAVSGGIGIVQFVAVLPAILYIDKLGRRALLRGGGIIMSFSHVVIALLVYLYQDDWPSHVIGAWLAVGCVYLFTAAYGSSYGPVGWVLPSEVFPLSVRSRGVAAATVSNWINNFLIGLLTPALMEASAVTTFMIFACASASGYVWATYVVPETANMSLEEIDVVFQSSAGQQELEMKRQIEQEVGLTDLIRNLVSEEDEL